jgi:hypothetical protein
MLGRVIHTDEAIVVGSNVFKAVMAVVKMKRCSSSVIDHIPTEVIQLGGGAIQSKAYKLSISVLNKEELLQQWKESIIFMYL